MYNIYIYILYIIYYIIHYIYTNAVWNAYANYRKLCHAKFQ